VFVDVAVIVDVVVDGDGDGDEIAQPPSSRCR
jgi:hypothetical protein